MPLGSIENVVANRRRSSTINVSYAKFYNDLEDVEYNDPDFSSNNKENKVKRSKKGESKLKRKADEFEESEASSKRKHIQEEVRSSISITKITKDDKQTNEILSERSKAKKSFVTSTPRLNLDHHTDQASIESSEPVNQDLTMSLLFIDTQEQSKDDVESDEELIVVKPVKKRVKREVVTKKKSAKMTSKERRLKKEADEQRKLEEQAIEAWRKEMQEVENYKLVVETGPHE